MRLETTVEIDSKRIVKVREVTPKNLRQFYKLMTVDLANTNMQAVLTEHWDTLLKGLGDCVEMPKGLAIDDCGLSTLLKIWEAFKEVNPNFLQLISMVTDSPIIGKLSAISNPTPTTSPSADTSTSGITDSPITPDAVS
ncbi:MAG: hypothetical protein PHP00_06890 [Thiotrichaceae bacterium]|nr:hypothetical protein [Thiotrichaceae bacterium]